ncbi:MAG: NAD(P)H-binding protein [Streptosporangiaceae bacterium]
MFGSTGGNGRLVLADGIRRGHEVTAFARDAGALTGVAGTITAAMASLGVSRLVATSAYGIVATRPYVVAGVVRRIFAKEFADQAAADRIITASELDWTILRGTRLTSKPADGPARRSTGLFAQGPYSLARSAFAAALVDLAQDRTAVRQIVNITA